MAATAIRFNPTPTGTEDCVWCTDEDARQAVVAILWQNPQTAHIAPGPNGLWVRHISWTCWRHIEREADQLRALGFQVLGAKDTGL